MEHFYPSAPVAPAEKRNCVRQKAFTAAHVHFNRGNSTYEALVKNISASGAKLRFGEVIPMPQEFEIRIGTNGAYHKAHVAWRNGLDVGVVFNA